MSIEIQLHLIFVDLNYRPSFSRESSLNWIKIWISLYHFFLSINLLTTDMTQISHFEKQTNMPIQWTCKFEICVQYFNYETRLTFRKEKHCGGIWGYVVSVFLTFDLLFSLQSVCLTLHQPLKLYIRSQKMDIPEFVS